MHWKKWLYLDGNTIIFDLLKARPCECEQVCIGSPISPIMRACPITRQTQSPVLQRTRPSPGSAWRGWQRQCKGKRWSKEGVAPSHWLPENCRDGAGVVRTQKEVELLESWKSLRGQGNDLNSVSMLKLDPLDILGFKFTRRTKKNSWEMTIQNGQTNISLDYVGLKKFAFCSPSHTGTT